MSKKQKFPFRPYDHSKEIWPPRALALGQEGALLLKSERPELALSSLNESLKTNWENADVNYARAIALEQLGRVDEAIQEARTTLSIKSEHNGARNLLTELQRTMARSLNKEGEKLFKQENVEDALKVFLEVIEMNPAFATGHNNLGVLYWHQGEVAKSMEHFLKALEIDPDDRSTVLNCGEILSSIGKVEDAKAIYSSYLKKTPGDDEVALSLRKLHHKYANPHN